MNLRPYQYESSEAFIDALKMRLNPVLALPTGSGKSLVIAHLASWIANRGGKVVVLAHVQELLKQNSEEYLRYSGRTDFGIYSSGLGRSDVSAVTFAGIQSVYRKPKLFQDADLVLIDEAHTVPPDGEGLMYKSFLEALPNARRGGVTATPWRLDGGVIYGKGRPFDVLAYQKSPIELVDEGYLSPLVGVATNWQLDLSHVKSSNGDYQAGDIESQMAEDGWLDKAVEHAVAQIRKRKHILVFCPTIVMAKRAADLFKQSKVPCGVVSSEDQDRDDQLALWTSGEVKAMANVDILTTGFNFPALDAIVCFRPTQSSSLWVQMLGRGMRKAHGKTDCLVLDYAGNLERLGGIGTMETYHKEKDDGVKEERPASEKKEKVTPVKKGSGIKIALTTLDPMLESRNGLTVRVLRVNYAVTRSKKPGKSHMLASYDCETDEGVSIPVSQFCCVEFDGGARFHSEQWFKRRGGKAPRSAIGAKIEAMSLPTPRQLVLRKNSDYINVDREIF
jgi:DNA repair protein RadD